MKTGTIMRSRLSAAWECAHAREWGTTVRLIRMIGGVDKLLRLDPDARRVLLGPHRYGSAIVHNRIHHPNEVVRRKLPEGMPRAKDIRTREEA